ncbi:MAG: hypothetical protein RL562_2666 [Planctomycetota bacterium]
MFARPVSTAFLVALSGLAGFAPAQNPFVKALPPGTIGYVSMPDIRTSMAELRTMPIGKMWQEQEVQDFVADAMSTVEAMWEQGMTDARAQFEAGMLPFDPDEMVKMRVDGMSMALTQFGFTVPEGGGQPMPKFGFVGHVRFGDSAPIWKNVVATGVQMMTLQAGEMMSTSVRDVAGVKMTTMQPSVPGMTDGLEMGFNMAWVGDGLLFGTLASDIESMLQNLQSDAEGGLASTAEWQSSVQRLGAQGTEMEMFLRPGAAMDAFMDVASMASDIAEQMGEAAPEMDIAAMDRAMDVLGLRSMGPISMASTYVDGRAVTTTFVTAPEGERKGLMAMGEEPLDMDFLRWVPKDAVSFSASRVDLESIYDALTGALRAYDEGVADMMMAQLGQMEEMVGLSLEKDLFGAFGTQLVSWSMPMAAFGQAAEQAYVIPVRDPARFVEAVQTIAMMSEGTFSLEKIERRGITVYQVRVNMDMDLAMGGINPIASLLPTFGFKDGNLVVAYSTGDVKRAFARMDREDDPAGDIRSNPGFAQFLGEVPTGATSLAYRDWAAEFEGYYQLGSNLLALIPLDEEIPFDFALLPDSQTLTQHLFPSVSWSTTTPEGFAMRSVSPFGMEVMMPALLGVASLGVVSALFENQDPAEFDFDSMPFGGKGR